MPNQSKQYLDIMLSIAKEAGQMSLDFIHDSTPDLKVDQSVITKADRAISDLTRERLAKFLSSPEHFLLDEEDPKMSSYLNQDMLDKTEFLWSIDPIDGTRLYANRMPLFGVSLGLIRHLKPWLGVVYFPMMNELFYCDGDEAFFVQNAFTPQEIKTPLRLNTEVVSPKSLFYCDATVLKKYYFNDEDFNIMGVPCAVVNLCWPTIGRGIGCYQRCNLWDIAGSWPIVQKAGFDFRRLSDGKLMDRVQADLFEQGATAWKLKEPYLITTEANFELIRSKMVRR